MAVPSPTEDGPFSYRGRPFLLQSTALSPQEGCTAPIRGWLYSALHIVIVEHLCTALGESSEGLFVEVFLKGLELVLLQHAALPPRLDESETVAHELGEGGGNGQQAYPEAAVLQRRMDEDDGAI